MILHKNISNIERKLIIKYCIKNANNSKYVVNDNVVSIRIVYDAIKKTRKYKFFFLYIVCALKFIKLYNKIK
jgi:CMP-N-acetylneuraminic acid synthetase